MSEDLKNAILTSKDKAQCDLHAKKILAHKGILAYILSKTVDEFKGMPIKEVEKHIVCKGIAGRRTGRFVRR